MNKEVYELPLGYRREERKKYLEVDEAVVILASRRQKYYVSAVNENGKATLISHHIICPYCNKEYTANSGNKIFTADYIKKSRVPGDSIYSWGNLQLSFFGSEESEKLILNSPLSHKETFHCPECFYESSENEGFRKTELYSENGSIYFRCELLEFDELFSAGWIDDSESFDFPIYEVIEFNVKQGEIFISAENEKGEKLVRKEITYSPMMIKDGVAYNILKKYKNPSRQLKRLFEKEWGMKLPYTSGEMTPRKFFFLTLLVGYNREFYSCVPISFRTHFADVSFKERIKAIHYAKDIPSVYENSGLPMAKTIRKIFFMDTGLFFYINEAVQVYKCFRDVNYFCRFLESRNAYGLLSEIHMRPAIIYYIRDFCEIKGVRAFLKQMEEAMEALVFNGTDYASVNPWIRDEIKMSWTAKKRDKRLIERKPVYSTPMQKDIGNIVDCKINGFEFILLRNSHDYARAGEELNNCLIEWSAADNPVVCVKRKGEYVAAIEVEFDEVVQILGYSNMDISYDDSLCEAVRVWMRRFNLESRCYGIS